MEFSRVRYVGDGITRTFVVPFPYLKPEHVFVHVNLLPVEFEWVNPGVIQLSEPPENGAKVVIFRETPREIRLVEFVDGSFLKASDLDQAMTQIFYIAQETADLSVSNYADTVGAMALATKISTTYHSDMRTWLNQVQTLTAQNQALAEQVQTLTAQSQASAEQVQTLAAMLGLGAAAPNVPGGNIDDNTIPTGFYFVPNTTSGTKPSGVTRGHLIVSREGPGATVRQLYLNNTDNRIWTRAWAGGQWSGWVEFYHTGNLGAASETAAGIIKLATAAEARAGTDGTKALSPLRLRDALNASGSAPIYACRAWVNFNGTGTVAIRASGNVSSITDIGVGYYTVNFTTAMPDTNYVVVATGLLTEDSHAFALGLGAPISTSTARVQLNRSGTAATLADSAVVNVAIFR